MPVTSAGGQWIFDEAQDDWVPNPEFSGGQMTGQAGGGFTKEDISRAMQEDLMRTGGKNIPEIKAIAEFALGNDKEDKATRAEAAKLRKEHRSDPQTKSFLEVQKQWKNMQSAGEGGAGDVSIMYSYIKMLDPTTAVREGELALAAAAAGAPDRIVKAAKRLDKKGAGLGPEMRRQMVAEGGGIYNNVAKQQKELNAFYSGLATDTGVDPQDVIGSVGDVEIAELPKATDRVVASGGQLAPTGNFLQDFLGGATSTMRGASQFAPFRETAGALGRGFSSGATFGAATLPFEKPTTALGEILHAGGQLAGGAKTLGGIGKLLGKAAPLLRPRQLLGEARAAGIAKAKPFLGKAKKELLEAGKDIIRRFPGAKNEFKNVVSQQIKNAKSESELLGIKDSWGRLGFLKGGGIKSGHAAELYSNLDRALRGTLKGYAPEAMKFQNLLRLTHEVPKKAGQASYQLLKYSALGRLLGI